MIKWYIDGLYAVHLNMSGHTGVGLKMGQGFLISASKKQKINTRISTESKIVGVYQLMPSVLWKRIFLEYQSYGVTKNIIYQDSKSAIILEKNDKSSSNKCTKHIIIRYFL